jgi:hypothetical protein
MFFSKLNQRHSLGFSSTYQQEKAESSANCWVLYSAEHLFNQNHDWILIGIFVSDYKITAVRVKY